MDGNLIRILLVEDDEDDYILISGVLKQIASTRYLLKKVSDFDGAVLELKRSTFDVVLLDYLLGAKTGLDVLKHIRGMPAGPPAIMLTGQTDYSVDLEAMKNGAADYIDKSLLRPDVLEGRIRYCLEGEKTKNMLRGLNRILNMVKDCSLAITRAGVEDALYRDICRIAVEVGGYRFCWVGLTNGDGALKAVAHAGFEDGFLRYIGAASENGEAGPMPGAAPRPSHPQHAPRAPALLHAYRSPEVPRLPGSRSVIPEMDVAFQTEDPFVVKDIASDPAFEPLRSEALKRGYASAVAVPLSVSNEFAGSLNIYSGETGAFDEKTVNLLRDLAHQLSLGMSFLRNMVEQKKAERDLRARERYFRSIIANMPEDIFVIGRDYRICDVNRHFLETIRRKRKQIVGRPCYGVFHNARRPCFLDGKRCRLEEVFRTGNPGSENSRMVRGDGKRAEVNVLYSPLKDETGQVAKGILAVRDISHEVRLESELRQAQKMEAIGTLAGGIAHDFNNILGIILGYSELARFQMSRDAAESSNLVQIQDACLRGKEVVKQILAFSRKSEHEKRPVSISSILKEALKLLRPALPATIEIRLDIHAAVGSDLVLADATQMLQVIMNLAANAADAMSREGGMLEIDLSEISVTSSDLAHFSHLAPGNHICINFKDTGCGIDPADIERIFEPYFSTKSLSRGTGLGLAVVHGIVKEHRGEVKVTSRLGRGSEFKIYLPAISTKSTAVEREPDEVTTFFGTETILMIDDEKHLADVYSKLLDTLGYHTTAKTDSREALELFRSSPYGFDLVITDQTMPKITGLDLARQMLQIRPDTPIIICSGRDDSLNEHTARQAGIRAFMTKPVLMRDLGRKAREILDESRNTKPA